MTTDVPSRVSHTHTETRGGRVSPPQAQRESTYISLQHVSLHTGLSHARVNCIVLGTINTFLVLLSLKNDLEGGVNVRPEPRSEFSIPARPPSMEEELAARIKARAAPETYCVLCAAANSRTATAAAAATAALVSL